VRRTIRRLTFATDAPHFGGAERYIVAMAHAARRRGIEPHIYWQRLPIGDAGVFDAASEEGLRVTAPEPVRTRSARGVMRAFRVMLHRECPDGLVINASGRRRHWLLCWLARHAGVPAVWVHQMVDGCDHRRLPPRRLGGRMEGLQLWRVPQTVRHRLAATAATAVVTLNAEDRERIIRWQGAARDKIRVIPHGVDCQRFRFDPVGRVKLRRAWGLSGPEPDQSFVVGTAGRLSGEKRVDLLIDATAILRARGIPAVAVIAGDGVERDGLGELARKRAIGGAVKFVSFVEDMPAFYSGLDVFALCSRTESFGLGLAEAMACQRAVVGTPTSGAVRQIDHQISGWQLNGFSPVELADALAAIYRDPDARRRMGSHARASVIRQFSIDLTLERTLRALRGAARERSFLRWPGMDNPRFVAMAAEDAA
jgi:glycosyltransferase involved in cell wall biosynthesis